MSTTERTSSPLFVLFSHDERLARTRHWVLEQARFRMITVQTLKELKAVASNQPVALFLLCNSLPAELRVEVVDCIQRNWPDAKIFIFLPAYPLPDLPADEFFPAVEGPDKLIRTVRKLIPRGPAAAN